MDCHVLVDFDGTIVPSDATDRLLDRFADPSWHVVEKEWQAGRLSSRECMERHVSLIRATPSELDGFVAGVEIDPAFPGFIRMCRRNGANVTVVSDGFDRVVGQVLEANGLDLPYYANRLSPTGTDRWRLTFPHFKDSCRTLMGNCKCAFASGPANTVRIMVGDGRSDFCISESAHFVLAKGQLAEHCRRQDLPHVAFRRFDEATRILDRWFNAKAPSWSHRPAVTDEA